MPVTPTQALVHQARHAMEQDSHLKKQVDAVTRDIDHVLLGGSYDYTVRNIWRTPIEWEKVLPQVIQAYVALGWKVERKTPPLNDRAVAFLRFTPPPELIP